MPADGYVGPAEQHPADIRRKGLRVALAIAVGFTWAVFVGSIMPFLAPFFACQFLLANSRPLPLPKALGLLGVIIVTGTLLQIITSATAHRPMVMLLLLGLIYFTCFFLQAIGRVGAQIIFFVLVVATLVPLMAILNHDLAASIMSIFVYNVIGGLLLMWMTHALIPDRDSDDAEPAVIEPRPNAMCFAVCNAIILLIAVVACLTVDALGTAIVVPITVTALLSQVDVTRGAKAAFGLIMVNLLGGLVACLAYVAYEVRPTGVALFVIVLFVGLIFGGRAVLDHGTSKLYAGALSIFLIVLGSGVSPLPGSAADSFSTRIVFIFGAIVYTIFMTALLRPSAKTDGLEGVNA